MPSMRLVSASVSTSASAGSRPIPEERRRKLIAPPVAIIVLEGMQSSRWAAPPMMSRSTTVTWAPRRAAYVAAVLPAGPPPMMRNRVATVPGLMGVDRPVFFEGRMVPGRWPVEHSHRLSVELYA